MRSSTTRAWPAYHRPTESSSARRVATWAALWLGACQSHAPIVADPLPPRSVVASPETTTESGGSAEDRRILTTMAAPPFAYEVSVLRRTPEEAERDAERFQSDGGRDPFSVRLLKGAAVVDELLLFQSSCGQSSARPVDGARGGDSEAQSWTTEYDTCDIRISVRTIRLSTEVPALLLTQTAGYEYRYSKHFLYAVEAERLREIWSFSDDTTGLDRSSTTVLSPDAAGPQDVAFIHELRSQDGRPASVTAQRLRFTGPAAQLTATPLPDEAAPLYVVALGNFRDASSARQTSRACLDDVYLFERSILPRLNAPSFFFGAVFARRTDADAVAASFRECPDLPPATILEYRSAREGARGKAQ